MYQTVSDTMSLNILNISERSFPPILQLKKLGLRNFMNYVQYHTATKGWNSDHVMVGLPIMLPSTTSCIPTVHRVDLRGAVIFCACASSRFLVRCQPGL